MRLNSFGLRFGILLLYVKMNAVPLRFFFWGNKQNHFPSTLAMHYFLLVKHTKAPISNDMGASARTLLRVELIPAELSVRRRKKCKNPHLSSSSSPLLVYLIQEWRQGVCPTAKNGRKRKHPAKPGPHPESWTHCYKYSEGKPPGHGVDCGVE